MEIKGVSVALRLLFTLRLKASCTMLVLCEPRQPVVPRQSSLDQVKLEVRSMPRATSRLLNFICKESYQLLPTGLNQVVRASLYSGNGRSDWATLAVQGKPA